MKITEKLQISNVNIGIIFMAVFSFFYGASSTYINAMITTIEKRFEFTSVEMGVLMAGNDIGYLTSVVFIAYFGSKKNRAPIVLSLSAVGMWLSCMIYTLPYYIYGVKYEPEDLMRFNDNTTNNPKQFCDPLISNYTTTKGPSSSSDLTKEISQSEKSAALFILVIAGVITGIASSPFWNLGISFLDDMAGAKKNGVYLGILYGTRSFSPIIGFLFGSQVLKYHESLRLYIDKYLPGQTDQKWIGAWWFGWLLLGFAVLLTSPFLLLLRAKTHQKSEKEGSTEDVSKVSVVKDLFRIISSAFRNKIYLTLYLAFFCAIVNFFSMMTFFTKYLEFHFRVSPTISNIYTSISMAGSHLISILISALVSYFIKMNLRSMNRFNAIVRIVSAVLFPILFIFTCENVNIKGIDGLFRSEFCSTNCQCQTKKMEPVCLNKNATYFSPCMAGCATQINGTYFGQCGCDRMSMAHKGFCEGACSSIYGFIITIFVIKTIDSMATVQYTQILLRLAPKKDTPVGFSLIGLLFSVLGILVPSIMGSIIDSACLYRDKNDNGVTSHCIIYDSDKLRYIILGIPFAFQVPSCIFFVLSWRYTPSDLNTDKDADEVATIDQPTINASTETVIP